MFPGGVYLGLAFSICIMFPDGVFLGWAFSLGWLEVAPASGSGRGQKRMRSTVICFHLNKTQKPEHIHTPQLYRHKQKLKTIHILDQAEARKHSALISSQKIQFVISMCLFLCIYVGVGVCVFIVFCVHGEFPCPKCGWIVTVNREREALNTTPLWA